MGKGTRGPTDNQPKSAKKNKDSKLALTDEPGLDASALDGVVGGGSYGGNQQPKNAGPFRGPQQHFDAHQAHPAQHIEPQHPPVPSHVQAHPPHPTQMPPHPQPHAPAPHPMQPPHVEPHPQQVQRPMPAPHAEVHASQPQHPTQMAGHPQLHAPAPHPIQPPHVEPHPQQVQRPMPAPHIEAYANQPQRPMPPPVEPHPQPQHPIQPARIAQPHAPAPAPHPVQPPHVELHPQQVTAPHIEIHANQPQRPIPPHVEPHPQPQHPIQQVQIAQPHAPAPAPHPIQLPHAELQAPHVQAQPQQGQRPQQSPHDADHGASPLEHGAFGSRAEPGHSGPAHAQQIGALAYTGANRPAMAPSDVRPLPNEAQHAVQPHRTEPGSPQPHQPPHAEAHPPHPGANPQQPARPTMVERAAGHLDHAEQLLQKASAVNRLVGELHPQQDQRPIQVPSEDAPAKQSQQPMQTPPPSHGAVHSAGDMQPGVRTADAQPKTIGAQAYTDDHKPALAPSQGQSLPHEAQHPVQPQQTIRAGQAESQPHMSAVPRMDAHGQQPGAAAPHPQQPAVSTEAHRVARAEVHTETRTETLTHQSSQRTSTVDHLMAELHPQQGQRAIQVPPAQPQQGRQGDASWHIEEGKKDADGTPVWEVVETPAHPAPPANAGAQQQRPLQAEQHGDGSASPHVARAPYASGNSPQAQPQPAPHPPQPQHSSALDRLEQRFGSSQPHQEPLRQPAAGAHTQPAPGQAQLGSPHPQPESGQPLHGMPAQPLGAAQAARSGAAQPHQDGHAAQHPQNPTESTRSGNSQGVIGHALANAAKPVAAEALQSLADKLHAPRAEVQRDVGGSGAGRAGPLAFENSANARAGAYAGPTGAGVTAGAAASNTTHIGGVTLQNDATAEASAHVGPRSAEAHAKVGASTEVDFGQGVSAGASAGAQGDAMIGIKGTSVGANASGSVGIEAHADQHREGSLGFGGFQGGEKFHAGVGTGAEGTAKAQIGIGDKIEVGGTVGSYAKVEGELTAGKGPVAATVSGGVHSPGALGIGGGHEARYHDHTLTLGFNAHTDFELAGVSFGGKVDINTKPIEDAGLKVASVATGAANTVAGGVTGAANTVGHGVTGAANTVAHGTTDAANTVAHGVTGAANTVGQGVTGAANTVAHGTTEAANTVAHTAVSATNTVAGGFKSAGNAIASVFCHAAGTLICMSDGTMKPVEQLAIGDDVLLGGTVVGRGEVLATDLFSYRGTVVNGRHAVFENGGWVRVEQSARAIPLDIAPQMVYPVVTEKHLLVCEEYVCADLAEMDVDIGAVGRLAVLNENTARNRELEIFEQNRAARAALPLEPDRAAAHDATIRAARRLRAAARGATS